MFKRIESGISGKSLRLDSLQWIKNLASSLGLEGAAFTRIDGSIRVIAEGEEVHLVEFIEGLKKAKIFEEEQTFFVNWSKSEKGLGNFYIMSD